METLHFPSPPLPAPCGGCGGLLCAECARFPGYTAVHFSTDGICAFGHRLDLGRLTEWIKAEGITGNYPPDQIAARVVAQVHPSRLLTWLDEGADYLRDMCTRVKDEADLTDEERVFEDYKYGHGDRPQKRRSDG